MKKTFAIFAALFAAAICVTAGTKGFPEGISEVEITFSYKTEPGSEVVFQALDAGVISDCSVNGQDIVLDNQNYPYTGHAEERLTIKNLHKRQTVRLTVKGVTPKTEFRWTYENGGEFHPSKIKTKILKTVPRSRILRVADYNIQNGMWNGQEDNYDRFVAYMKEMDADVCIICEGQTIYYSGTKDKCLTTEQYLPYRYREYTKKVDPYHEPEGWLELASRYGHGYVKVGAHQDSFPVIITSKYPITLVQKLGGPEISHGGLHAQIQIGNETINLVGFHTYPHAFGMGVKGDEARARSKAANEGHKYREYEISLFMKRTILNPEYASEKNWLIMGDTNCPSPLDEEHLKLGLDHPSYLGHKYILGNVPVTDLMKVFASPDKRDAFVHTTQSRKRIDMIYGSGPMLERMINAFTPHDEYTRGERIPGIGFIDNSSDHLPVIVDFELF